MSPLSEDRKQFLRHLRGYALGSLFFLAVLPLAAYGLSRYLSEWERVLPVTPEARWAFFIILGGAGLFFAFHSLVVQYRMGRGGPAEFLNIEVSPKTQRLVVSGPYRMTRNPMLFGTCLYYCALALACNSLVCLAAALFFTSVMLAEVKLVEEPRLSREFGEEFTEYRRRVSFFLPWRMRKE